MSRWFGFSQTRTPVPASRIALAHARMRSSWAGSRGSSTSSSASCSGCSPFASICPAQNVTHAFTAVVNSGVPISHDSK